MYPDDEFNIFIISYEFLNLINETYCIACVDICICLEVFQHLFQVSTPSCSKKARIVIRLKKK